MNDFFNAQFSYCPLTWMFNNRKINNKINKLHEKCLRTIYNNNTSTYSRKQHFQKLIIPFQLIPKTYRPSLLSCNLVNGFSPDIMKDVVLLDENSFYNTRNIILGSIQGVLEPFMLDLKHYHILHLKFGSQFQKRLKSQNLSPPLKMRLKNGNRQIVLAAYAEHIYFRLALCNYFIIQSEAFAFLLSIYTVL